MGSKNPSQANINLNDTHGSIDRSTPVFNEEANTDFNQAVNFPFGIQQNAATKSEQPNEYLSHKDRPDKFKSNNKPESVRVLYVI